MINIISGSRRLLFIEEVTKGLAELVAPERLTMLSAWFRDIVISWRTPGKR